MPANKVISEDLRFERKYLITDYATRDVEQLLKYHPSAFSEIYHTRSINNIYFDTLGFNNYYDNVEGEKERLKVRIRWYDDLFGNIEKPILELKIKNGLLGKKESYPLSPFILNTDFSKEQIFQAVSSKDVPIHIRDLVMSLKPTLLNRYSRKYFLSADKNFRVTIDEKLTYYKIGYFGNTFLNRSVDHHSTVLELKYDSALESEAKIVGNGLPFPLTKNSKYLQGIERVLF
jgi:SPX domain protein involved in polyphosphate accumulation